MRSVLSTAAVGLALLASLLSIPRLEISTCGPTRFVRDGARSAVEVAADSRASGVLKPTPAGHGEHCIRTSSLRLSPVNYHLFFIAPPIPETPCRELVSAPPELPNTWRFTWRNARYPRAPSRV